MEDPNAAKVLDQLLINDGEFVTLRDLARSVKLTTSQTRRAIDVLRDHLAAINSVSYVAVRGGTGGIALTVDNERAEEYAQRSAEIAAVQLRRVLTGSVAAMVKNATTRAGKRDARAIERHLVRLVEDLGSFTDADVIQSAG